MREETVQVAVKGERVTMRWTEDLSVGIDAIDSQHREVFAIAGSLLDAVGTGGGLGEVTRVVWFLEEYVMNHFTLEELYMKRYHYPEYPSHKAEHTAFIGDFYDLRDELDRDGVTAGLARKLADRVGDWLAEHIGRQDKALGAFLRSTR